MTISFSKKLICIVIAILTIILSSFISFADDAESAAGSEIISDPASDEVVSSSVEQELLAPDLRNPVYLQVAKDLKASTASTYDIDDIYYIVQECANALVEFDGSEYVSVTEYVHACLSGLANGLFNGSSSNPYLRTINSNIASIQAAVYGPAWDGSGVTNSLWNALQTLYSVNHADQLAQMAKQQGIIDALVGNTQYSISYKLDNLSSNLNTIDWVSNNDTWTTLGIASSLSNAVNGTYTTSGNFMRIQFPYYSPTVYKFINFVRLIPSDNVKFYNGNGYPVDLHYYVENSGFRSTLYIAPYSRFQSGSGNTDLILEFANSKNQVFTNQSMYYLPYNSQDAYTVLSYIQQYNLLDTTKHIDNDIHTMSGGLDKLVQMYASDDELAAKQAQQQYESDSLTDFTGGGSAAASGSDRNGIKSVSNTAKTGLDGGGSISNGLSVFDSNNSIWGWFSQDNASYFNNPQTRSITADNNSGLIIAIPDYLSGSDDYMNEHLGDNNGQSYR